MCDYTFDNVSSPIIRCKKCGKAFEKGIRSDEFCSNYCKTKDEQDEAIKKHNEIWDD